MSRETLNSESSPPPQSCPHLSCGEWSGTHCPALLPAQPRTKSGSTARRPAEFAKAALALCLTLVSWLVVPVAQAAQDAKPNPHTRALTERLDPQQKVVLRGALQQALIRSRSGDRLAAIPPHQVYHTVFLDLLLDPAAMVTLPAADRALIDSLPAHDDRRFAEQFDRELAATCRVIDRLPPRSPAAAAQAVRAYRQAQRQIAARLDRHYDEVLSRLSPTGQALVEAEIAALVAEDSLVHASLDFDALSFSEPEFVVAFFKDTCANNEQHRSSARYQARNLRDQLDADIERGAVQVFQPQ